MKIVIAGGTGYLGQLLSTHFLKRFKQYSIHPIPDQGEQMKRTYIISNGTV